eukprot:683445-Pelagomonas_calceolata.AAC.1
MEAERSGEVVGCMPCDKTSMAWYQHMPLSTAIRSRKLQEKQHRCLLTACEAYLIYSSSWGPDSDAIACICTWEHIKGPTLNLPSKAQGGTGSDLDVLCCDEDVPEKLIKANFSAGLLTKPMFCQLAYLLVVPECGCDWDCEHFSSGYNHLRQSLALFGHLKAAWPDAHLLPRVCHPKLVTPQLFPHPLVLFRHLEAARPDAPKPTPLASFIAPAERARYASMPPDGLVVLQVELRQQLHEAVAMSSKTSSLGANAKSTLFGGKPNQGSDKGQEEVLWAPLHAHVRPWCDEDSVYNMLSYDAQISRGVGSLQRAAGSAQGQGHEQQQQQYKNQQLKEQYEQQGGQPIKVAGGTDQGQSIEATIQQIVQQLIKATEASDQAKQQQRGPASSQVGEVSMKDDLPGGKNGK